MPLLNQLNPKRKLQLLLLVFFLTSILAYCFAIEKTIEQCRMYAANKKASKLAIEAPSRIIQYKAHISKIENKFRMVQYERSVLFEAVNSYCRQHHLVLSNFGAEKRITKNGYHIITNPIEVKGLFTNIVQLIYYLEHLEQLGHIVSSEFHLVKDRISKKENLISTLFLQNILPAN